jgi:integrase
MPRKARDQRLDTRTTRLKLKPRREPYWRNIQEGRAIGYRRIGGKAGTWIARHYDRAVGRQYESMGVADDMLDADGTRVLTFPQAQDKAREWFARLLKEPRPAPPVTVSEAWEHYRKDYHARGGKAPKMIQITVSAHIVPKLGDRLVTDLTAAEIKAWHHALASAPARRRTGAKAQTPNVRVIEETDQDGRRARRSTANNILTILKAMLNLAHRDGLVPSDDAWRRVKPFPKVASARIRYLTDEEAARLVNASDGVFRPLVIAALLTGCRYQELARLRREDVDLAAGTVTIREAKGGSPRHVVLTDEAKRFFMQQTVGNARTDLVLPRRPLEAWAKSQQFRPLREACRNAGIQPPIGFHILRHTHASRLAMRGVPMQVIAAQLGHADIRITAKHYAHLAPSHVADTIRAAFGAMGVVPATNVVELLHA